jgi:hypothetical protein
VYIKVIVERFLYENMSIYCKNTLQRCKMRKMILLMVALMALLVMATGVSAENLYCCHCTGDCGMRSYIDLGSYGSCSAACIAGGCTGAAPENENYETICGSVACGADCSKSASDPNCCGNAGRCNCESDGKSYMCKTGSIACNSCSSTPCTAAPEFTLIGVGAIAVVIAAIVLFKAKKKKN